MLKLEEIDQKRIWIQVVKDAQEDLKTCPEHLHADCPAADAYDFFMKEIADEVFGLIYPENGQCLLDNIRTKIQPCKHSQTRHKLMNLLR